MRNLKKRLKFLCALLLFISLKVNAENHVRPAETVKIPPTKSKLSEVLQEIYKCYLDGGDSEIKKEFGNWYSKSIENQCQSLPDKWVIPAVRGLVEVAKWDSAKKNRVQAHLEKCASNKNVKFKELLGQEKLFLPGTVPAFTREKDNRPDTEGIWIIDMPSAIPSSQDEEREFNKYQGLFRPWKNAEGKEVLPPYRMVLKYVPEKKAYGLFVTDSKGNLEHVIVPSDNIPGCLVGASRLSRFSIRGDATARIAQEAYFPQLQMLFRFQNDYEPEVFKRIFEEIPLDPKWQQVYIAAKKRLQSPRGDHPLTTVREVWDMSLFENESQIGLAVSDEPLAHAWSDPSEQVAIAVDEKKKVCTLQLAEKPGDPRFQQTKIIAPKDVCPDDSRNQEAHYTLALQKVSDSGLEYKVKNEKVEKRGWYLLGEKGELVVLEEDPNSEKGELSLSKKHAIVTSLLERHK